MTERATIGSLVFGGTGSFNLDALLDRDAMPDSDVETHAGAGQAAPSFVSTTGAAPKISFSTLEIARALGKLDPLAGLSVDGSGAGITSLAVYYTKYQQAGVRKTGNNHFRLGAIALALAVPESLEVAQNGNATLKSSVHMYTSDGLTDPWTVADAVALPHTPAVDEVFTLAKGSINGTQVKSLVGWTYDFGLTVDVEKSDGDFYPTFITIGEQNPKLTARTSSPVNLATFSLTPKGLAQGATASDFYLRKRSNRGRFVADNVTEHIRLRINADQGIWTFGKTGGGQNKPNECELVCTPTVGAAAIATWGLAVAIP